jgi:hypothetical protein
MRNMIIIAALSLSACGFSEPVKTIGNNTYTISEMNIIGGNVAEHAARHCAALGQTLVIEATTTQNSYVSNAQYAVMVFRCA